MTEKRQNSSVFIIFLGKPCAIKIFDKASLRKGQDIAIVKEIQILAKLRHPNIVALLDAFETKTKVYVVMELAAGNAKFS